MKKILILAAFVCFPTLTFGQTYFTGRFISGPAALRPTCNSTITFNGNANPGDIYNDTDDPGVFKCSAGTWSTIGGGGGGGMVYPPAGVPNSTGVAWGSSYQVGCSALSLVQLNGIGQLCGSAANLTNFPTLNQSTTGTAANLSGTPTVPNGTAATTQAANDNSTKLATTAYVDSRAALPTETQFCGPYYSTVSSFGCLLSPATAGLYQYAWNPLTNASIAPAITQVGFKSTAISGATNAYTFAFSDCYQQKEHDKAGSAAVTLTVPTPTTLNNAACHINYANHSGSSDVYTPSGGWTVQVGTAAAAATYSIPPGQFCNFDVDAFNANNWLGNCVTVVSGTTTIASGSLALSTSAISSGTCTSAQTQTATGALTSDGLVTNFSADPTGVTGYLPTVNGMLTIIPYLTANTFNIRVCNNTSASITPGAVTLNFRVVR